MKRLKYYYYLLFAVLLPFKAYAQTAYGIPRYDLYSYGTGAEGFYTAEVFIYQTKPNKNVDNNIRKAALHGTVFKGLNAGNNGLPQRAIASASDESKHQEFFSCFFSDSSNYERFVSVIDGSIRVERVEKKLYRIRALVSISKDALRKHLEQNGIVESFKDMF